MRRRVPNRPSGWPPPTLQHFDPRNWPDLLPPGPDVLAADCSACVWEEARSDWLDEHDDDLADIAVAWVCCPRPDCGFTWPEHWHEGL